jgi:phosphatidylinositol glycan class O
MTEVRVLGFANAYRAPFAVFWVLGLAPVWLTAQRSTQMTLALVTAAHLELVNAARDARALQVSFSVDPARTHARLQQGLPTTEVEQQQGVAGVRVDEVVPIVLLARLAFFAGRHQATFVSLQWKVTFVLMPTLSYSLSSLSMTLNTLGPTALIVLGVPLLGIWNIAPLTVVPVPDSSSPEEPRLRAMPAQEAQRPHCR